MKRLVYLLLGLLLQLFASVATEAAPVTETAGQILARLNKMTPEQRQKTLVEKAKAEGEIAFYSSLQAQQIDPFTQAFRNAPPLRGRAVYRLGSFGGRTIDLTPK